MHFIKKNNLFIAPLFLLCALLIFTQVNAQEESRFKPLMTGDTVLTSKEVALYDIFDIISSILKKEAVVEKGAGTITTKPVYSVVPAVGYTLQTKLAAVISGNVVFRVQPEAKVSTITASATYTQNKQFFIPVISNISTKDNRYKFIGDLRYYKYPQSTFGLGSCAPITNEDPMNYNYFRFHEKILRKIKGNFFVGAGYELDYHWKISHKGNLNGTHSDYEKYGMSRHSVSSGLTLNAIFDSRDNPINAKKGFFTSLQLRNNLQLIGSHSNWQSVTFEARKYFAIPGRSENTLALWSYNSIVIDGKPPYLDLPSTGWDSYNATGRGFIQGRYRGLRMVYLESEYRFKITANGLLGGVVYVNEEAFSGGPAQPLEAFQTGYGTGLRIKLNKLSSTNLSIDYAFGTQGSKGLFITVGELF